MFPGRFFTKSFFPGRFFPPVTAEEIVVPVSPVGGGGGGIQVLPSVQNDDREVFEILMAVVSSGILDC